MVVNDLLLPEEFIESLAAARGAAEAVFANITTALEAAAEQTRRMLAPTTSRRRWPSQLALLRQAAATAVDHLDRYAPANLRNRFVDVDALQAISSADGNPIAWIPRPGLLDDLLVGLHELSALTFSLHVESRSSPTATTFAHRRTPTRPPAPPNLMPATSSTSSFSKTSTVRFVLGESGVQIDPVGGDAERFKGVPLGDAVVFIDLTTDRGFQKLLDKDD